MPWVFTENVLLFGVGAFILRCYNDKWNYCFFFLHFMDINKMFRIILGVIMFCVHVETVYRGKNWPKVFLCSVAKNVL